MKTKLLTFAVLALLASSAFAAAPTYLYRLYSPGVKGAAPAPIPTLPILPLAGSVFATWNPSDKGANTALSNNNLTAAGQSYSNTTRATQGKSSGKWYWELHALPSYYGWENRWSPGIADSSFPVSNIYSSLGSTPNSWGCSVDYAGSTVPCMVSWTGPTASAVSVHSGSTYMVALDMDNHTLFLGVDGVWVNNGVPAAGTGAVLTGLGGTVFPAASFNYGAATANFGAASFQYPVPGGFHAGVFQ